MTRPRRTTRLAAGAVLALATVTATASAAHALEANSEKISRFTVELYVE